VRDKLRLSGRMLLATGGYTGPEGDVMFHEQTIVLTDVDRLDDPAEPESGARNWLGERRASPPRGRADEGPADPRERG
jgi:hypothetical protein